MALGRHQDAYDLASTVGYAADDRQLVFIAGMAALERRRYEDAVKQLQKYIDFGPRLRLTAFHAVARIMLARALTGAGRPAEARRAYDDAFRIWNHADPDLPLLVKARADSDQLPRPDH
jgi:hypothetical protein